MNARREGKYRGYFNGVAGSGAHYLLSRVKSLEVPAAS